MSAAADPLGTLEGIGAVSKGITVEWAALEPFETTGTLTHPSLLIQPSNCYPPHAEAKADILFALGINNDKQQP